MEVTPRPRTPPRLSAGVVVVRGSPGTYRYLLLRAYRYWDFPKGLVVAGENPLAAARREVQEETGLSNLEFRWGERYTETAPYGAGKVARYYLAMSPSGAVVLGTNPTLGRPEHHGYCWADYKSAQELLGPRLRKILDWAEHVLRNETS